MTPLAHPDPTTERNAWRDVYVVFNNRIMANTGSGIDDDEVTDRRLCLDDRTVKNNGSVTNDHCWRNNRARVTDRQKGALDMF